MAAEHTATLLIRLPPGLLAAARARAADLGIGLSAHLRDLIAADAPGVPAPAPADDPGTAPDGPPSCPVCGMAAIRLDPIPGSDYEHGFCARGHGAFLA